MSNTYISVKKEQRFQLSRLCCPLQQIHISYYPIGAYDLTSCRPKHQAWKKFFHQYEINTEFFPRRIVTFNIFLIDLEDAKLYYPF